ncbi:hypothetical protein H4S07_001787 [Coemansia furcata]|uniref:Uncharacterized protein n=1 Tax=Coemansia furcata TaxID=417177 RepID=A0ACC1LMH0_9FUNG|nr:hypothetical protein H4S07_001787 [Coemansia furcata]
MRQSWQPLLLLLLVLAAVVRTTPTSSLHSLESASVTSKASVSPEVEESADTDQSMDRILSSLVQHAFGPQHEDHAELYYRARFFTARLTARMQYIVAQQDQSSHDAVASPSSTASATTAHGDDTSLGLTQAEVDELNSIRMEMWLASRKLYQSWGCLSYDLTLCNGESGKTGGSKPSKSERAAMTEWEKRLSAPFVASKRLPKQKAEEIRNLMQGIQSVLLA